MFMFMFIKGHFCLVCVGVLPPRGHSIKSSPLGPQLYLIVASFRPRSRDRRKNSLLLYWDWETVFHTNNAAVGLLIAEQYREGWRRVCCSRHRGPTEYPSPLCLVSLYSAGVHQPSTGPSPVYSWPLVFSTTLLFILRELFLRPILLLLKWPIIGLCCTFGNLMQNNCTNSCFNNSILIWEHFIDTTFIGVVSQTCSHGFWLSNKQTPISGVVYNFFNSYS